jgi:hypothetical protein
MLMHDIVGTRGFTHEQVRELERPFGPYKSQDMASLVQALPTNIRRACIVTTTGPDAGGVGV